MFTAPSDTDTIVVDESAPAFSATKSGSFNDVTVWQDGVVPSADCTIIVGRGVTLKISSSQLDVNALTIYVNGILQIVTDDPLGFTFANPVNMIIGSKGKFRAGMSTGRLNLKVGSVLTFSRKASFAGINTKVYAYGTSVAEATLIDGITLQKSLRGPFTYDFLSNLSVSTYSEVTFVLRKGGSLTSGKSWPGFLAPFASFCKKTSGCSLVIPSGLTLSTADLDGVLGILFDTIKISYNSTLQLGTPDSDAGFRFQYSVRLNCYGTLEDVTGNSGGLKLPPGSAVNFYATASFQSDSETSLIAIHRVQIDRVLDRFSWDATFEGPVFFEISNSGRISTSSTRK